MKRSGLLMVMMEPPAALLEEFNAWYDTEHLPERVILPGVRRGERYVCVDGYPRYMALYDLDGIDVLQSPEYLAVSGSRFSPWTKRVTSHMPVYRIAAEQVFPGDARIGRWPRLLVATIRAAETPDAEAVAAALSAAVEALPEATEMTLFASDGASADLLAIIGLSGQPAGPLALHRDPLLAGRIGAINMYVPYDPTG